MSSVFGIAPGPVPLGPFAGTSSFGAAAGSPLAPAGNIFRQTSQPAINPGSTGNDNVLAIAIIPAGAFDIAGRGIYISAAGSFGATANNKRLKIIVAPTAPVVGSAVVGGTTIADSLVVATNGGGWSLQANIFKYGAPGSNTQLATNIECQVGPAVAALLAPVPLTLPENAPIIVVITGNATTAVSDILFNWLEGFAKN